jgi:hypothetical protein
VRSLPRILGQAERALRAILDDQLDGAGLTFLEWASLSLVDGAGALGRDTLISKLVGGKLVPDAGAGRGAVDHLVASAFLAYKESSGPGGARSERLLVLTAAGEAVFRPVRHRIDRITGELYGDLPPADLEVTQRTLAAIAGRAQAMPVARAD